MKKLLTTLVLACSMTLLTACPASNTWPVIIATAQSMALLGGVFYPPLSKYSTEVTLLLRSARDAALAYQADKNNPSKLVAYRDAIAMIQKELPQDLQALSIPEPIKIQVTAATSIILDWVDAYAAANPAMLQSTLAARAERGVGPAPKHPSTKAEVVARWDKEVCHGEAKCVALVK